MDIKGIKLTAHQIYKKYRKQIIPEFFYVGYISLLAQYLQSGLFSFFVSLFLCPIGHGYVKCSMKLVDEEDAVIDYHESMIGIIDFPRVAPAYLMRKAIILFVTLITALPLVFSMRELLPSLPLEWFSSLGNAFIQTEFFIPNFQEFLYYLKSAGTIINVMVSTFVYLFLTALFMPVPYVMEIEEFSWSECLSYSIKLMKGHIFHFFQLYFYYCLRHVLYWGLTGLILLIVGSMNEILMLFCMVLSLFIYIDVFKGRFEIAKYLFYQKIRGEQNEEYQGD